MQRIRTLLPRTKGLEDAIEKGNQLILLFLLCLGIPWYFVDLFAEFFDKCNINYILTIIIFFSSKEVPAAVTLPVAAVETWRRHRAVVQPGSGPFTYFTPHLSCSIRLFFQWAALRAPGRCVTGFTGWCCIYGPLRLPRCRPQSVHDAHHPNKILIPNSNFAVNSEIRNTPPNLGVCGRTYFRAIP